MALSLEQQLAQVSGTVIPSTLPAGQQPTKYQQFHHTDPRWDRYRTKMCPICDYAATRSHQLRMHFVKCVKTYGNPSGARWDDNFIYVPRPSLVKQERAKVEKSSDVDANPATKRNARTQEQRDERQHRYYERLASVNGIVIPSKLAPGEAPVKLKYEMSEDRKHACPICGSLHKKRYHVQSHFAVCVAANGNPAGARWNDKCQGTTSRTGYGNAGVEESQDEEMQDEMQDVVEEDHKGPDLQSNSTINTNPQLRRSHQLALQSISPPPSGFEPFIANFLTPSSNNMQPYNLSAEKEALINQVLLSQNHEWHGIVYYMGETYNLRHPFFKEFMTELQYRGMLGSNFVQIFDIEKADVAMTGMTE